jgi:hypothetical protein
VLVNLLEKEDICFLGSCPKIVEACFFPRHRRGRKILTTNLGHNRFLAINVEYSICFIFFREG